MSCEVYIHVTVHRNRFILNNQADALIIQILFCYKTLHISGHPLCPSSGVFYCTFGTGKFHAGFLMTVSKQSQDGTAVPS